MKFTLLAVVCLMAIAIKGFPTEKKYIDGQYLVRIDESMFQTKAQVLDFSEMLEKNFGVYFVKYHDLKTVKLLLFKGDHEKMMEVKNVSGIKYIQRNLIHSVAQTCQDTAAPQVWGLDRIGQRDALPYTDPRSTDAVYEWGEDTGAGVVAYVADTGIDVTHSDFGGRATHGYTAGSIPNDEDNNGHGTHCAGTIGSNSYGVAKEVSLVAVKVLRDSGFGSSGGIVDGLEWILNDHILRTGDGATAKSVINISLGGGADDAMDDAVQAAIDGGVLAVVAAGNADSDACNTSPARLPEAITVGATSVDDTTWWATNWGPCVDIYGPGDVILSTTPGQSTDFFSGTSMATPHVVGVVARYQSSLAAAPSQAQVRIILLTINSNNLISELVEQ